MFQLFYGVNGFAGLFGLQAGRLVAAAGLGAAQPVARRLVGEAALLWGDGRRFGHFGLLCPGEPAPAAPVPARAGQFIAA